MWIVFSSHGKLIRKLLRIPQGTKKICNFSSSYFNPMPVVEVGCLLDKFLTMFPLFILLFKQFLIKRALKLNSYVSNQMCDLLRRVHADYSNKYGDGWCRRNFINGVHLLQFSVNDFRYQECSHDEVSSLLGININKKFNNEETASQFLKEFGAVILPFMRRVLYCHCILSFAIIKYFNIH